ncbi:hypothetical protein VTP01DRAFT_3882 [Rhizomucor pusillus]|uniref:uncharacterized protein n=1 Tax=Rhizomucor pusillus TaxID=4840 RepID=UPI003744A09D
MPGPGTIFAFGAGVAGAAAYAGNRRRKSSNAGLDQTNDEKYMSPHAMGRRGSKGVQNDLYEDGKQAELFWQRNYGANFSHNSDLRFPRKPSS